MPRVKTAFSMLTPWLGGALVALALACAIDAWRSAHADQPHMNAALVNLTQARDQLVAATSDKGGHRAKALKLIGKAMAEVEAGIRYDNLH